MGVWFGLGGVLLWKKRGVGVEKKEEKKRKTMLREKKEHNSEIHGLKKEKSLHVFVWWSVNRVLPSTPLILSVFLTRHSRTQRHTHTHTLHTHRFCVCSYKERQLAFQPGSTGYVWWSNKLYNLFFFPSTGCCLWAWPSFNPIKVVFSSLPDIVCHNS